jgi:hypothetical protein
MEIGPSIFDELCKRYVACSRRAQEDEKESWLEQILAC